MTKAHLANRRTDIEKQLKKLAPSAFPDQMKENWREVNLITQHYLLELEDAILKEMTTLSSYKTFSLGEREAYRQGLEKAYDLHVNVLKRVTE